MEINLFGKNTNNEFTSSKTLYIPIERILNALNINDEIEEIIYNGSKKTLILKTKIKEA